MNAEPHGPDVHLPVADSIPEFRRTATDLFFTVAWQLGEYYDSKLQPLLGENWVAEISEMRGEHRPFALHDPVFTLKEPSYHSDSRIRICLPKTGRDELLDAMDDLLKLRNGWIHASIRPSGIELIRVATKSREVAAPLNLPVADDATRVLERVEAIQRGELFVDEELEALRAQLGDAESRVAALQADAQSSKRDLQAALAGLDAALGAVRLAERISEPPPTLPPGSRWDYPRGSTRLRLSRLGDVLHPETLEPFDSPDGRASRELGRSWLRVLPAGGDLWLDDHGNVTCHLREHFVLLDNVSGRTVEVGIGEPAPGFLLPGSYLLKQDGTIVDRSSGRPLAEVRPDDAQLVGERLLNAYPSGGKIALTSTNHVVADIDDRWTTIGSVTVGEWF
jgi:hypothetical protein